MGKSFWKTCRENLETVAIAIVAAILIRTFFTGAYWVSSESMEDELLNGDFIFVNKIAYQFGSPEIGDIIVFRSPGGNRDFIKRIVALPGDTVEVRDKVLYINGRKASLPEKAKYIDRNIFTAVESFRDNYGPTVVPGNHYFVMGDNRDNSRDSRFWGCVPCEKIEGRAMFIYWSWQPDPEAPGWEFPYIINAFEWVFYAISNLPSHVRWERLAVPL